MTTAILSSDIEINEAIVRTLLKEQFALHAQKVLPFGEGWDNAVYLVNDEFVFRFPRREIAVPLLLKEMRILPALKKRLSLSIPEPVFLGQASKTFQRPFYGHALLKGQSGSAVRLSPQEYEQAAEDVAAFLQELHAIDVKKLPLSEEDIRSNYVRTDFDKALPTFNKRLEQVEQHYDLRPLRPKMDDIIRQAASYQPLKPHMGFLHGDMYHRHLIFDERHRLSSVIDWGDCLLGDVVSDLGIVYQFLPKAQHARFFARYGAVDEAAKSYARFLGLYLAVALLWFGHDRHDQDLIQSSLWTFAEI